MTLLFAPSRPQILSHAEPSASRSTIALRRPVLTGRYPGQLLESTVEVGAIAKTAKERDALGAERCVGKHLLGSRRSQLPNVALESDSFLAFQKFRKVGGGENGHFSNLVD